MAGFNIAIPGSELHLIEVDGGNSVANPQIAESLGVLYPGERMDVIVQEQQLQADDIKPETAFIVTLDKE